MKVLHKSKSSIFAFHTHPHHYRIPHKLIIYVNAYMYLQSISQSGAFVTQEPIKNKPLQRM